MFLVVIDKKEKKRSSVCAHRASEGLSSLKILWWAVQAVVAYSGDTLLQMAILISGMSR